jgi:hypothetical protein
MPFLPDRAEPAYQRLSTFRARSGTFPYAGIRPQDVRVLLHNIAAQLPPEALELRPCPTCDASIEAAERAVEGELARYKEHLDDIRCDILDAGWPLGDDSDPELTPRRLVREMIRAVRAARRLLHDGIKASVMSCYDKSDAELSARDGALAFLGLAIDGGGFEPRLVWADRREPAEPAEPADSGLEAPGREARDGSRSGVESGQPPTSGPATSARRRGIYVASRSRHAPMWKQYRREGYVIGSTWIDEAGEGETKSYSEFWERVAREIRESAALVLFVEVDDEKGMQGAFVEVGMALAAGIRVFVACGTRPEAAVLGTWVWRGCTLCGGVEDALRQAQALFFAIPPARSREEKLRALVDGDARKALTEAFKRVAADWSAETWMERFETHIPATNARILASLDGLLSDEELDHALAWHEDPLAHSYAEKLSQILPAVFADAMKIVEDEIGPEIARDEAARGAGMPDTPTVVVPSTADYNGWPLVLEPQIPKAGDVIVGDAAILRTRGGHAMWADPVIVHSCSGGEVFFQDASGQSGSFRESGTHDGLYLYWNGRERDGYALFRVCDEEVAPRVTRTVWKLGSFESPATTSLSAAVAGVRAFLGSDLPRKPRGPVALDGTTFRQQIRETADFLDATSAFLLRAGLPGAPNGEAQAAARLCAALGRTCNAVFDGDPRLYGKGLASLIYAAIEAALLAGLPIESAWAGLHQEKTGGLS